MRSSYTGGGKTRLAVADICKIAVPWFYDLKEKNGFILLFLNHHYLLLQNLKYQKFKL